MAETSSVVFTLETEANKPVRALTANPDRVVWSILNGSATDAFYGYAPNVATSGRNKGWPIRANDGSVEDDDSNDEVWVISTASVELAVQEVSEVTG